MPIYLHIFTKRGLFSISTTIKHVNNGNGITKYGINKWRAQLVKLTNGRSTNLLMLSRVSSSLNNLANPKISSLDTRAPVLTYFNNRHNDINIAHIRGGLKHKTTIPWKAWLTLFINSSRSSAVFLISPLCEFWISFAISFTVSWRNLAYSILAFSFLFNASYKLSLSKIEWLWSTPVVKHVLFDEYWVQ